MPLMQPPPLHLGEKAHDFNLPGTDGRRWSLEEIAGRNGTLVMFICNHCPYVKATITRLVDDARVLQSEGIGVVAIMPNDTAAYPADSFENMKDFAREHGFSFPYLVDETQETAKNYGAVCTPDFFGYNAALELQFRGRLDESGPSRPATVLTRKELLEAMRLIAETGKGPAEQTPSIGCGIKWKATPV